jgi:hypothetical protein
MVLISGRLSEWELLVDESMDKNKIGSLRSGEMSNSIVLYDWVDDVPKNSMRCIPPCGSTKKPIGATTCVFYRT